MFWILFNVLRLRLIIVHISYIINCDKMDHYYFFIEIIGSTTGSKDILRSWHNVNVNDQDTEDTVYFTATSDLLNLFESQPESIRQK